MSGPDENMTRWARERREERQEANSHQVYVRCDGETKQPLLGWGGITLQSSDNVRGSRDLEIDLRPVLLGLVEVRALLSTQPISAGRARTKKAYLYTTPNALRELAKQLLDTADAADELRVRPKPVR